jgi:two-component sensor histidine kinase
MAPLKSSQQRIAALSKLSDGLREIDRLREKVIIAELSDRTLQSASLEQQERGMRAGMKPAEIIYLPPCLNSEASGPLVPSRRGPDSS